MQYTLKQAMATLSSATHAYGVTDVKTAINRAIQSLAGMTAWECLRKTIRFLSAGPEFSLPQGCAGLVRVCVNGRPTTLRGRDFKFLQSGPGDTLRPPAGFRRVNGENIIDLGWFPVMVEPQRPSRLFAYADGGNEPPVIVRGLDSSGREIHATLVPNDPSVPVAEASPSDEVFHNIFEIVLDDSAEAYVTLFAADAAVPAYRFPIGLYHPYIKAPQFRRYQLQGMLPGRPVEILAETRVDPVPLIRDSDVLPLTSLDPIEWMIRYDWLMKANEADAAMKYQNQAAQWLKAQEITDNTVQTPIVVNSVFDGSMGEVSEEAFNV